MPYLGLRHPNEIIQKPPQPQRVTVCFGLWSGGILIFWRWGRSHSHGQWSSLSKHADRLFPSKNQWRRPRWVLFQKDGATCHTSRGAIVLLDEHFENQVICRFGHVNWPPRNCDLTRLHYFWGETWRIVAIWISRDDWTLEDQHICSQFWVNAVYKFISSLTGGLALSNKEIYLVKGTFRVHEWDCNEVTTFYNILIWWENLIFSVLFNFV